MTIEAIKDALSGEIVIVHEKDSDSPRTLSRQEVETLNLMAKGLSSPEIAKQQKISLEQVKYQIEKICDCLGAITQAQAICRAQRLGLVKPVE